LENPKKSDNIILMEENKNKEFSFPKTLFSFLLSLIYVIFGYLLASEYPNIATVIKILGVAGFFITAFYLAINVTTWSSNFQQKIRDYFALWFEIAYTLLVISIIAFTIRFFVIQPFLVKGESMEPNFKDKEYLIVNEISYRLGEKPKRGDVIVFKFPRDPKENYIKRIIGLPEEKVKTEDGKIFIINKNNPYGTELKENYIPYGNQVDQGMNQEWNLSRDEFFVLGDNRLPGGSSDSRSWGPLPRKNIIGKVWFTFWPLKEAKFILHPQYNF